ncbi:MAG: BON domain-containing protein [Acidobacteriota bacterium]
MLTRFRTIPRRVSIATILGTVALVGFTACGNGSSNAPIATDGNAISAARPNPSAPTINADKAKPTNSPGGQNETVAPTANTPSSQIGSGGNDLFLFTKARSRLDSDTVLKSSTITIEVKAGVVTLSGAVANAAHKSKAEQLVREVEGVKAVNNRLRITS